MNYLAELPFVDIFDAKNNRLCLFYATQRGKIESDTYDWRWDNLRVMIKSLNASPNDGVEESS